ncbi:polysaccharide pyruvyl transferase family protein [Thiomicrorhabdus sp.]|uniref:polysaccharide pyruvyl transferase family protein n=1 Tax=Thiomicrorhabdus sp. TaxID=2039724 RepID=UPI002AA6A92F|nr:polysaccharide pyruvyl transferase family protein [Thiomicrorhabdus sp.]
MVDIVHWNPKRSIFKKKPFSYIPIKAPVNNFGDLLGPLIIEKILQDKGIVNNQRTNSKRLLGVGSILHFAKDFDTIWGSGRNGKIKDTSHNFKDLDVRAVRGPLTRDFLINKGINCPEIYGDPALLLPHYFPELKILSEEKKFNITIIPNLNDLGKYELDKNTINPTMDLFYILKRIVQSKYVIGSSLHAIIVAEAFGVPARLITSENEDPFKYHDYFQGSGRTDTVFAKSIQQAIDMGGEAPIKWHAKELIDSFPSDLWNEKLC